MMFKSKKWRDYFLLTSMFLVTLGFIVYVIVPGKGGSPPLKKKKEKVEIKQPRKHQPVVKKDEIPNVESDFNKQLEEELAKIYSRITGVGGSFANLNVDSLKKVIEAFDQKPEIQQKFAAIDRYLTQLRGRDSGQVMEFIREKIFITEDKRDVFNFNLTTSLLMIVIQEEALFEKYRQFPSQSFKDVVDLKIYSLLDNHIEKDYQSLPLLFFFELILERVPVYSSEDPLDYFSNRISNIQDLSPSKDCGHIKETFRFWRNSIDYRLEWTEEDGFDPDDHRVFQIQLLPTIHFLHQTYLVFPHGGKKQSEQWIKELCRADRGDIELIDLKVYRKKSPQGQENPLLLFSEGFDQFIILLEPVGHIPENWVTTRLKHRIDQYNRQYQIIQLHKTFTNKDERKLHQKTLTAFGHYLKKRFFY